MGEAAFTRGDRGDMEISDVGWCLGSLCGGSRIIEGRDGKPGSGDYLYG